MILSIFLYKIHDRIYKYFNGKKMLAKRVQSYQKIRHQKIEHESTYSFLLKHVSHCKWKHRVYPVLYITFM